MAVCVDWQAVVDPSADLAGAIGNAFGPDSLGLICVDVSSTACPAQRRRLLKIASALAALPAGKLKSLEDPSSKFNFGWSSGKEYLSSGIPDTHKGSFYANPTIDNPGEGDPDLAKAYPAYFRPNIWPDGDLPDLEPAFKDLGRFMYQLGLQLAVHCDKYLAAQWPGRQCVSVQQVIASSRNHKARLLHYFPPSRRVTSDSLSPRVSYDTPDKAPHKHSDQTPQHKDTGDAGSDDHSQPWCGWHTDHGSLTGLTPAMYIDPSGEEVACPDPKSGLYVRNRQGQVIKVNIPPGHIAFQVGEALQVLSGGALMATPHYVRAAEGSAAQGVSRNTFAVFLQPDALCPLEAPAGVDVHKVAVGQWQPGQTFGTFSSATFTQYYKDVSAGGSPVRAHAAQSPRATARAG